MPEPDRTAANEPFAAALRRARAGTGLSQEEFAEALGVTGDRLSNYERGASVVPAFVLVAAARAAGMQLADLLAMSEEARRLADRVDDHEQRLRVLEVGMARILQRGALPALTDEQQATDDGLTDLPD